MEPTKESGVEKINQLVRAVVVFALTFGLVYGFVVSKVVSTETFVVIASVVFTWWFKSRDENATKADTKPNASPTPQGATP